MGPGMRVAGQEPLPPLVGRRAELDAVRSVIGQAAQGRTRAVLIAGAAGIGKTRLMAEALAVAEGLGFRVLYGACDDVEQDRPLRALVDALGSGSNPPTARRPELVELLRVGADAAGRPAAVLGVVDGSWVIVESLVDVLEDLASTDPVALAIEDLQWADPLTLRVVHAVVRRMQRIPLVLLATIRPGSHGAHVDRTIADVISHGAMHLVLDSLDNGAAAELAGAVTGLPPGPGLLEQVGRAGGNPLFVIELVRALADDGALEVRDGRVEARWESPPPTLRLTLLRRLSHLPEDGMNLLRIASVLGSTFSVAELALLSGRTSAQLLPGLTAAMTAGLLNASRDRLAFHHELVRDALYHDLPPAIRKGLHREAGIVLRDAGAGVERVAAHIVLGAETGDADAVAWLRRAADTAASRAPATAVHLLSQALDISAADDVNRQALAAEMVAPLMAVGRHRDAEALARHVLAEGPDVGVEVVMRTGLASVLSAGARYPEAIGELARAATVASDHDRLSLDAARSLLLLLAGQVDGARDLAERALVAGEQAHNDYACCVALQTLALVALAEGVVADAVAKAQRAVGVAARSDAAWASYVVPHLWLGTALCDADRFAEAAVQLDAGRRRAEQTGNVSRVPLYHWAIAELRLSGGHWDDALAEAQAGLGFLGDTELQVGDVFAHAICAHVALHRGELGAAHAAVDEARRRLVAGPVEIGFEWMSWIGALLLEAQGKKAAALAALDETWDLIAPLRYVQATARAMGPDLVRMAKAAGDHQRAASVTEELERSGPRAGTATAKGLALRCRGLLDEDVGALLAAVAAHREGPRPYQLAAACEDAGVALGRVARASEAVSLLSEATAIYDRLHASWDVARVQSALRSLGVRRTRPPRRPTFGWESLTPTEARVVELVAEGMTNPEIAERLFVSRRTVATHVEHVFQKLGHANRVELAADAARRVASEERTPSAASAPGAAPASPRSQAPARRGG